MVLPLIAFTTSPGFTLEPLIMFSEAGTSTCSSWLSKSPWPNEDRYFITPRVQAAPAMSHFIVVMPA